VLCPAALAIRGSGKLPATAPNAPAAVNLRNDLRSIPDLRESCLSLLSTDIDNLLQKKSTQFEIRNPKQIQNAKIPMFKTLVAFGIFNLFRASALFVQTRPSHSRP
jgi:hypothetical protein